MKPTNSLHTLKALAKRYARARTLPQHRALDLVAAELKFPHWNALVSASKKDWQPTSKHIETVQAFLSQTLPTYEVKHSKREAMVLGLTSDEPAEEGKIDDHTFRIVESLGDVYLMGDGWSIYVGEAPNAPPRVKIAEQSDNSNPIHNPAFLKKALQIAATRSEQVRAGIATDWPRRSTKPDAQGRVRHPLFGSDSDSWFCLHCNSAITGRQIADSLWHCPDCKASPLDIFESAFWLGDGDAQPMPTRTSDSGQSTEPTIDIQDTRLQLRLDEENITLLIRSALVEDAANASERLGALFADIDVDEDNNDVWITFDEDLWPETKDPIQALAVAELLGIELEQSMAWRKLPFAWPGLGEHTFSTLEYTKMMLDAYAGQDVDRGSK